MTLCPISRIRKLTEKEPPKKIDIVIKGKEKEGENSTDVLLNIIISLNINKEGK